MAGGTLSGTVTELGGVLDTNSPAGATLDNVTWLGTLAPADYNTGTTLTIRNGITLTGADGTGPGNAVFDTPVVLDNTPVLDNASIQFGLGSTQYALSFHGPSLTLGSALSMNVVAVSVGGGQTLTNDGTLISAQIDLLDASTTGTVINNGLWGGCEERAAYFQNNGTITGDFPGVRLALRRLAGRRSLRCDRSGFE